jgi:hypothetical protein
MRISERRPEVFFGESVIIEIIDQWCGPDYRYVKVRAHDGSMYILRESRDECEIIMFSSARAQGLKTEQHDLARSAQSRQ